MSFSEHPRLFPLDLKRYYHVGDCMREQLLHVAYTEAATVNNNATQAIGEIALTTPDNTEIQQGNMEATE
jgi:hypothetical protein